MQSLKRLAYTAAMKLSDYLSTHGSQTELARAINAQPQLVWQWSTGARPVPLERCVAIEKATDGVVTCEELRPDKAADFAYLRGMVEKIQPNQPPAHTPLTAITVIADGAQTKPAAPAQNTPADAAPGAAATGDTGAAWDGVERRDPDAGPNEFPDLDRRAPDAARLAGQGV